MDDFLNLKNMAIFAVLGGIVSAWSQVRGWIRQTFFFFVRTDKIQDGATFIGVFSLLLKEGRRIRLGSRNYADCYRYVKSYKDYFWLTFLGFREKEIILYKGWVPVLVSGKGNSFSFLLGTFDTEKFIRKWEFKKLNNPPNGTRFYISKKFAPQEDSMSAKLRADSNEKVSDKGTPPSASSEISLNAAVQDRHYELNFVSFKNADIGEPPGQAKIEFYPNKDIQLVESEIARWKDDKGWFTDRGIPRRRSYLLIGEPGSGKSAAIKYLGRKFDLPIISFDLSGYNNKTFSDEMSELETDTIILFEDIDSIWDGRKNLNKTEFKDRLTFDHFINVLSGVEAFSNHIVFITTNHVEKLDPAMIRPGRIDRIIEIGRADSECRRFIAHKILRDWSPLVDQIVAETEGQTAAQVENKCIELALRKAWET